jgi:hypothetical protein
MEIEIKTQEDQYYHDSLENFLIDFKWNNEKPRIFMRCCFHNKIDFLNPTLDFLCNMNGFGGWKLVYLLEYYNTKSIIISGAKEYLDDFYRKEAENHRLATEKKCLEFPAFKQYISDSYSDDPNNIFK